eukprot:Tamp_11633.p5 GENE.Tamp_11633~~Tamp_11633.p5  ORF type:complete len:132 (-),score=9.47 Tamp_11633:117-512(-)
MHGCMAQGRRCVFARANKNGKNQETRNTAKTERSVACPCTRTRRMSGHTTQTGSKQRQVRRMSEEHVALATCQTYLHGKNDLPIWPIWQKRPTSMPTKGTILHALAHTCERGHTHHTYTTPHNPASVLCGK